MSECHGNERLKRKAFRRLRKTDMVGADVTCCGRLFQVRAAATGKARSPTVDSRVRRTFNVSPTYPVDDRSVLSAPNCLVVPISRLSTVGSWAFPVAGLQTWNDLSEDVTSAESLTTFRRLLKTHLFMKSSPDYLLDINWLSPVDPAVVPLLRPSEMIDWLIRLFGWLMQRMTSRWQRRWEVRLKDWRQTTRHSVNHYRQLMIVMSLTSVNWRKNWHRRLSSSQTSQHNGMTVSTHSVIASIVLLAPYLEKLGELH